MVLSMCMLCILHFMNALTLPCFRCLVPSHHRRDATTKKGPDPAGYCWSHGWRVGYGHNSSTCEHPKEGHQTNTTRQNTKGGSSANKD